MQSCVALMYHVIDEPRSAAERQWCCSPQAFRDQMHWLRDEGWIPVSMSRLVDWMRGGDPLPSRAVCITVDDGTRCLIERALPVLSDLSFPAIAYVVTGRIGADNDWLQREGWARRLTVDVSDLHSLAAEGIEIGSHSVHHADLPMLTHAAVDAELSDSRRRLEDLLGRETAHFAYPFGRLNPAVRHAVEAAGYRSSCTVADGRIHRNDDPFLINRVEVYHWDDLQAFASKLRWGSADLRLDAQVVRRLARRTLQRIGLRDSVSGVRWR